MRSETAPAIRLEDYTPPAYRIQSVHLDFCLDPEKTRVTSRLDICPDPKTPARTSLILDGDGLTLISVELNGESLQKDQFKVENDRLELISPPAEPFELRVTTEVNPTTNTQLMGLYRSSGTYCTQCEADGFRRITYFLDRPDCLAVYTTRLEAPRSSCPVLLSNGNFIEGGEIGGTDRHYAVWHDPHPKPAYLFALVAGDLSKVSDSFTTASGSPVDLNIFVEHGKEPLCGWAMDSLKRSMRWDEETHGREYDLEVFNIVAVSDFNMGAMENKGLNIFNDKYVLADPETATDQDYANIEAVIAHEYFHNWTGNRITCRDWFQLCLKEGLTVFRDQEFSADMRSRPVKRIADVKLLKTHQFPEDAGPLAHPVRPRIYHEINNFYTATVYEKGAEIIRMLKTLLGEARFGAGLDLYFDRHDGDATTIEAFLKCFEDSSSTDLSQFALWYEQAGTPMVTVESEHDPIRQTFSVSLSQEIAPVPGQKQSRPTVIPLKFGLIGDNGQDLEIGQVDGATIQGDVLVMDKSSQEIVFKNVPNRPVLSLLRAFSAPIRLSEKQTPEDLMFLAMRDNDPFNRWQAIQTLALNDLVRMTGDIRKGGSAVPGADVIEVFRQVLDDPTLDDAMRAQMLTLPSESDVAQEIGKDVDPEAIHAARQKLRVSIATTLADTLRPYADTFAASAAFSPDAAAAGKRALSNRALHYYAASARNDAEGLIWQRFSAANNMTDRLNALTLLVHDAHPKADIALEHYLDRHKNSALAMDKWFQTQASAPADGTVDRIRQLFKHPLYDPTNPNRVRSLLQSFAMGNPTQFARTDGAGFELIAEAVLNIDKRNPQVASRLLTSFRSWRAYEAQRSALAESALMSISTCEELSRDSRDIIDRTLQ